MDTRAGALKEAGDIVDPLQRGVIGERDVAAGLYDLARGDHPGRTAHGEITLFKSMGRLSRFWRLRGWPLAQRLEPGRPDRQAVARSFSFKLVTA